MTDTIQVVPNMTATLVVAAGDGPTLVNNPGPNTVFLGDNDAIRYSDAYGIVALNANGYINVDGQSDLFATIAPGLTQSLNVISGGLNFFSPPSLSGLGGVKIFNQVAAPTQPPTIPVNSLWFTSTGQIMQWNGAAWVQQQFSGQQIIQANTIFAAQLAAGIIYAGIVDGTLIQGATVRVKNSFGATIMTINKSSGTWLLYADTGSVTQGALIASGAAIAGTDEFTNPYESGLTAYQISSGRTYAVGLNALSAAGLPGLSLQDINHPPTAPAGFFAESSNDPTTPKAFSAITSGQETGPDVASFISVESALYSAVTGGQIILQAGDIQHLLNGWLIDYTASTTGGPLITETTGDGNTYHLGHLAVRDNGVPHLINSTTPIVTLTSPTLAANKGYHIRGFVTYLGNQAAGAPIFSWGATGGLVLGSQQNGWQDFEGGGVAPVIHNNDGALGAVTGPVFAASTTNWLYRFEIYVTINTTGQLQVNAAENTAGDAFTIHQAYMMVEEY